MNLKVSICITAYNHGKYIAQALDSALMQETDFDFEILVGEDDSTDETRDIIKEYKENYPDKIRLFLNDRKNVIYINGHPTGRWNFINNLNHADGQYIALLEGDDYWTDPYKLQKQVDLLDNTPGVAICFHWVSWLTEETGEIRKRFWTPLVKQFYSIEDFLEHNNFIPTCSVVFRNFIPNKFPYWFCNEIEAGDFPLYIMLSKYGKIALVDEDMAVYRRHAGGLFGGNTEDKNVEKAIRIYKCIGRNMKLAENKSFKKGLSNLYLDLTKLRVRDKRFKEMTISFFNSLQIAPFGYKFMLIIRLLANFR